MITITDLEFRYAEGDFQLRVPELAIQRGATVALIGPSGTGKTTLLNLVAGVIVSPKGHILTNNIDVTQLNDSARRDFRINNIGLVFQEFELLGYLNVFDNILLPYRINQSLRLDSTVRERTVKLAERMGIGDKLGRYVNHLSQGERQRVAVCRALLPKPDLVLADEPTGNLDPRNKNRVLDILFDYIETNNTTLVTVTHDYELLGRFGRIIEFNEFHTSESEETPSSLKNGREH